MISSEPHQEKKDWKSKILNDLLTGSLVLAPVVISLYVLYMIFRFADNILGKVISAVLVEGLGVTFFGHTTIPGVGLLALLGILILTGWAARTFVGQQLIRKLQKLLSRVPILNYIYNSLAKLSEVFSSRKNRSRQRPVLIPYPSRGLWTLGIITSDEAGKVQNHLSESVVPVFVVTTPNPTTGFLIYVPRQDIVEVNMNLEEAIKVIMSGGILQPETESSKPRE